jgi:integrase
MATSRCLLQSDKENANIFIQFSVSKTKVLKRKTGFTINPKDWSKDKAQPIQKDESLKFIKSKLDKLKSFINDAYNTGISIGTEFTGDWLQLQINLFNNKIVIVDLDILTNSIDEYLSKRQNLTKGSKKNLDNLKKVIVRYETGVLKGRNVLIREIGLDFIDNFTIYFKNIGCSDNYIGTYITLIKVVVNYVSTNGIPTHPQFSKITTIRKQKEPDEIIVLSTLEQSQIKNATLTKQAHINARKWLLLGCLIGQRASDLLYITESNIKDYGNIKIIELKQQKTGKLVAIPLIPEAQEIIESGMPYKINLEHFNSYIKDVCEIAKINTVVKGKMRIDGKRTLTVGDYEKWQVMSSHVCRRSFATNFYGKMPTSVLMGITAHGTETMFLNYIGKTSHDNAHQFLEYFSKMIQAETTAEETI